MLWWKKNRDAVVAQQAQAERALEFSQMQQEKIEEIAPKLEQKMSLLARLNRENNFARKLEAAYQSQSGR